MIFSIFIKLNASDLRKNNTTYKFKKTYEICPGASTEKQYDDNIIKSAVFSRLQIGWQNFID